MKNFWKVANTTQIVLRLMASLLAVSESMGMSAQFLSQGHMLHLDIWLCVLVPSFAIFYFDYEQIQMLYLESEKQGSNGHK